MKARIVQIVLLLGLSGAALFFSSGCDFDFDPVFSHAIIPYFTGRDLWNICVPLGTPQMPIYERYTVAVNPDGTTQDLGSETQFNVTDCDFSVGTAGEVDPAAVQASFGSSGPGPSAQAAGGAKPKVTGSNFHPVNALPYARAVPFGPSLTTAQLASIPVNCDPNGSYYAVNHTASTVTHLNSCTQAVISTIPVFGNPLHPALTPDGSLLLVTSNDGAVNFISTATDKVVFTLQTPGDFPSGIAISPDGNTAYVTNYDVAPQLLVIDIPSRTITKTITLPLVFPKQVFLTPDGAQAWVNYYAGRTITIVDTFSGTVAANIQTNGTASTGIAFNATGTRAFVAESPQDLFVYDTGSLTTIADIPVGAVPVDVTLTPDFDRVYVTSYASPNITIVDAHSNQVLATIKRPAADQRAFVFAATVP